jgi:hypothetical protein
MIKEETTVCNSIAKSPTVEKSDQPIGYGSIDLLLEKEMKKTSEMRKSQPVFKEYLRKS